MGAITNFKRFTGIGELRIGNPFSYKAGITRRQIYHRGSAADVDVIRQMFQCEDYGLHHFKRGPEMAAIYNNLEKPLIIDAGANIGASVCWFQKTLPRAHIVAFEPDNGNYELLRKNTEGLNVDLHRSAVGATDGAVALLDPGDGEWGYQTKEDEKGNVKREGLAQIVASKRSAGFSPFIAKIDIEGGEQNLFSSNVDWVDLFPVVIVELHDYLLPRLGTSQNFLRCIAARNRDFINMGENIFSIQN
jgi:FkbM family methyltransferase